jgi:hypothetical protein
VLQNDFSTYKFYDYMLILQGKIAIASSNILRFPFTTLFTWPIVPGHLFLENFMSFTHFLLLFLIFLSYIFLDFSFGTRVSSTLKIKSLSFGLDINLCLILSLFKGLVCGLLMYTLGLEYTFSSSCSFISFDSKD